MLNHSCSFSFRKPQVLRMSLLKFLHMHHAGLQAVHSPAVHLFLPSKPTSATPEIGRLVIEEMHPPDLFTGNWKRNLKSSTSWLMNIQKLQQRYHVLRCPKKSNHYFYIKNGPTFLPDFYCRSSGWVSTFHFSEGLSLQNQGSPGHTLAATFMPRSTALASCMVRSSRAVGLSESTEGHSKARPFPEIRSAANWTFRKMSCSWYVIIVIYYVYYTLDACIEYKLQIAI